MDHVEAKHLQQLKSLSSFSFAQLEKLAAALSIKSYEKNATVFDQDEEAKLFSLLIPAVPRFSYINSHENQAIVTLLPAGELFGLDALIPKTRHPFRCEAFESSTVGS